MIHRVRGASVAAGVLAAAAALNGCNHVVKEQRTTTIVSDPPGAAVFASGVEVGVTPLTIRPDDVFPPRFVGFEYRAAGTLSIKKPGCETYSRQVDDAVLSRDIHVKLQCDSDYRPAPSAPARKIQQDESIPARLQRLEALRKQGLITADEYKQIRQKILGEL